MKRRRVTRRHAWTAGTVLSLAAMAFASWDKTMAWWTARENHARFEMAVRDCEEVGRRWWKGACVEILEEDN